MRCPQQSGIRDEVQFAVKFQSKVCFGLSAFACVKDGSEYQQNDIFEWYKLSSLEEQDEGFVICKVIIEAGVLHCDARGYEGISLGGTSSTSLWVHSTMGG
jgi:hypothetical protein